MRAFNDMGEKRKAEGKDYLVGEELSIMYITVVCTLGSIDWGRRGRDGRNSFLY
jgi:hypothetical protein